MTTLNGQRKPSVRIGVAPLAAVLCAAAAAARIAGADLTFTESFAQGSAAGEAIAPAPEADQAANAAVEFPKGEEAAGLYRRLADRKAALDERARALETRERALAAAEARLAAQLKDARKEIERLDFLRAEREAQKASEFEALSQAYERMRPRDAARIFEVLDKAVLVPIAAGMRTQSLSATLAEMDPQKAEILTRLLADREKSASAIDGEGQ